MTEEGGVDPAKSKMRELPTGGLAINRGIEERRLSTRPRRKIEDVQAEIRAVEDVARPYRGWVSIA